MTFKCFICKKIKKDNEIIDDNFCEKCNDDYTLYQSIKLKQIKKRLKNDWLNDKYDGLTLPLKEIKRILNNFD